MTANDITAWTKPGPASSVLSYLSVKSGCHYKGNDSYQLAPVVWHGHAACPDAAALRGVRRAPRTQSHWFETMGQSSYEKHHTLVFPRPEGEEEEMRK